ncbi:tyrosine-type recombinase/integrase, partial [Haloferax profundi]|uniref:tyrosine-type recombinase/integrase n=1 Tax=Haloferax profundi TaxID=1544718 RepID=UPI001E441130
MIRGIRLESLKVEKEKEHRKISPEELREMVMSVTNLRARAIILLQMKLGLRAGEVANLRLEDIHMNDADSSTEYSELATHPELSSRQNLVYIPSRDDRRGNKSVRPRLLPLDSETRATLDRYLFARPDNGEPWVFLSKKSHTKLTTKGVNQIWKDAFHPEYAETDEYRAVTSHFGRHRFTT